MKLELTIEKRDGIKVEPESRSGNSFRLQFENDVAIFVDRRTLIEFSEMVRDALLKRKTA